MAPVAAYRAESPDEQGEISPPRWIAEHATAAFVGLAAKGPAHLPTLVHSWDDYERRFGGLLKGRYLGEAVLGFFANGGQSCYVVRGNDLAVDDARLDDLVGNARDRSGLAGLEAVDDVSAVAMPDLMSLYERGDLDVESVKAAQGAMIAHGELMGDRMVILDCPPGLNPEQVWDWRRFTGFDSKFAALYYPWLKVGGQDRDTVLVPPCGHIAGVHARTDLDQHAANVLIRGAIGVDTELLLTEQDVLNPLGVNALVHAGGRGLRVWGARTLSSDPAWRFVRKRRLMNFISRAIRQGSGWVVFEDARDKRVQERLHSTLDEFFAVLWRAGLLWGDDPVEAYFVKCDAETNPAESVDQGMVIAECGLMLRDGSGLWFRVCCFLG